MVKVLATLQPLDKSDGSRPVLRVCNTNDRDVNGYDSQQWWPAIARAPAISIDLFDGTFSHDIAVAAGGMQLRLDVLRQADADSPAYVWSKAPVEIFVWDEDAGTASSLMTARVERMESANELVNLTFQVDIEPFETDVLTAQYAGTGGAEGGADLTGRLKPWVFGRAKNVEPVLIDATNNVWQVSGYGAVNDIPTVYERGSAFGASEGDEADYAALVAASIPEGSWATCLAEGMFRLGAPAYGLITADVEGDAADTTYRQRTGAILQYIASELGISSSLIDATSFNALDTARAYDVNIYLTEQTSFLDLARRMVRPLNAVAGIGFDGVMFVSTVGFDTSTVTFDAQGREWPPVAAIAEQPVRPPYKRIMMGADRCWRVHGGDEIAFGSPIVPRGRYDGSTLYVEGNIVNTADAAEWLYINNTPTSGNAPPTWPTTSNTWWENVTPPGVNGTKTAPVTLYKRGATSPAVPSGDVTYTFATAGVSGTLDSWTQAVPSGTDPVWRIDYQAVDTAATVTIGTGDWTSPVKVFQDGADGSPGADGAPGADGSDGLNSAPVILYRRTATASSPSVSTTGTTNYFFSGSVTGAPTGWTIDDPGAGSGAYLWTIQKVVSSALSYAQIANNTWPSPILKVQDGADGTNGTDGVDGAPGADGADGFSVGAYLLPPLIRIDVDANGDPTSYTGATSTFAIEDEAGNTIASNFTLATASGGNPAGLTVGYVGMGITISGGFVASESPAELTIEATGSGAYSGVVFRLILVVVADYSEILLDGYDDFNAGNNMNGDAIPSPSVAASTFTHRAHVGGAADITFHWDAHGAMLDRDIDGWEIQYYIASAAESDGTTSFNAQAGNTAAICWGARGYKAYVAAGSAVFQYECAVPYDLTTANHEGEWKSLAGTLNDIRGLAMSPDGTTLFALSNEVNDTVFQFTLSTAFDITSASYASKSLNGFSFTEPGGIAVKPDGTLVSVVGYSGTVRTYSLSTGWDISTASLVGARSIASSPVGCAFSENGTRFFVVTANAIIYEYFSTAFAPGGFSSLSTSYSAASPMGSSASDIVISDDGLGFYLINDDGRCKRFTAATAFSVTGMSAPSTNPGIPGTAYTFGSNTDREGRDIVPAEAREFTWPSLAGGSSVTARVRAYRRVNASVDTSGLILSSWASASIEPYNPYRAGAVYNRGGYSGGKPAYILGDIVDIDTEGVNTDKVLTASIAAGAIGEGDWYEQGGTLAVGASGGTEQGMVTDLVVEGDRVVVDFVFAFEMDVTNPNHGDEFTFTVQCWAENQSTFTDYYSPDGTTIPAWTIRRTWDKPSASGGQDLKSLPVHMSFTFDNVLPAGTYDFGYKVVTNAGCGMTFLPNRYMRVQDLRAMT